jgi:hypothetical protein
VRVAVAQLARLKVLLRVAVGANQPAGQLEVLRGKDQRLEIGVAEDKPATRADDPIHLLDKGVGAGRNSSMLWQSARSTLASASGIGSEGSA